jgi:hypothetical protein
MNECVYIYVRTCGCVCVRAHVGKYEISTKECKHLNLIFVEHNIATKQTVSHI